MSEVHGGAGTSDVLSDLFVIEGHLLATRSADAYKAIDRDTNAAVCLWKLRHPLAQNSDAVRRFLGRMQTLREISPQVCDVLKFGVDAGGIAYAAIPPLDGQPIAATALEGAEAERRFTTVVRLVNALHSNDLVCGDLCDVSFIAKRGGDVSLVGIMGSFDSEAVATAMLPPIETLHFVAPEQRMGGGLEPASDVYSLGVLGYRLFSGHFPFGKQPSFGKAPEVDKVPPLASYMQNPPAWGDEVLRRCLGPDPRSRYQNAAEVIEAIASVRRGVMERSLAPARIVKDPSTAAVRVEGASTHLPLVSQSAAVKAPAAAGASSKLQALVVFLMVLLAVLGGALFWRMRTPAPDQRLNDDLSLHLPAVEEGPLKDAIGVVGASNAATSEKAAQLEKLVASDDPLAHAALVATAAKADSPELREMAERAVLNRARRLGLLRSAEQVKQFLRTRHAGEVPAGYSSLLKSLDTTLPMEVRSSTLREAYPGNERTVLRLAAAYALDTDQLDAFQPLLAQLVGDLQHLDDASAHSSLALMLYDPELSLAFGDDVVQRKDKLSDADVMWLLGLLAARNDINVRVVASQALERNLLSQLRKPFLVLVRDRDTLPSDILLALVRGGAGKLSSDDLRSIGSWYEGDVEDILYSVCADSYEPAIVTQAIEILGGRSLTHEPGAALVGYLREKLWAQRTEYGHAVGVLALSGIASDEDLAAALKMFEKQLKSPSFARIVFAKEHPRIVRYGLEHVGASLPITTLLEVLDYPDKDLRIAALNVLSNYHDVALIKIVLDHYDKEKDPDVRKVYKEKFWTIREREP